jgi:hypothetical protein
MVNEALVLAIGRRRDCGERHLLCGGEIPTGSGATSALPNRLGIGRRLLDLRGLLRVSAIDSLTTSPMGNAPKLYRIIESLGEMLIGVR